MLDSVQQDLLADGMVEETDMQLFQHPINLTVVEVPLIFALPLMH